MNESLARTLVKVKLPAFADKQTREVGVVEVNTLNEIKYNPTFGTVVDFAPGVNLTKGDTVYFNKNDWNAAKENRYDGDADRDKGLYFGNEVLAIKEGDDSYMILPYGLLYMSKREDGFVTMLNGHALCEPIEHIVTIHPGTDLNNITIADLREETYVLNKVKVLEVPTVYECSLIDGKQINHVINMVGEMKWVQGSLEVDFIPSWLQPGDTAYTLRHCDIPLVEPLNGNDTAFIIELENLIAKYDPLMKIYKASPNRIIIEVVEMEQSEGIQIDSQFAQKSFGKVISAGTGVECKEGDVIVFPRNAGTKGKLPILPGGVQLEVIGKDDYFSTVINND